MKNTPDKNFLVIQEKGLEVGNNAYRLVYYAKNSGKRHPVPFRVPVVITGFSNTGRVRVKTVEYMPECPPKEPRVSRWAHPRNTKKPVLPDFIEKR